MILIRSPTSISHYCFYRNPYPQSDFHPIRPLPVPRAVAALKESRTLRKLTLVLTGNAIGVDGAMALATLGDSLTLQTLSLDLGDNDLGIEGLQALGTLQTSPSIHTVTLDQATLWLLKVHGIITHF